ncbi:iron chelate uptake ABC transporter family permease subunit [Desulfolithobacter sp.]
MKQGKNKLPLLTLLLPLAMALFFVLDLGTGTVAIPPDQVLAILLGHPPERPSWQAIVLLFRLPKALTAAGAGAALALSGLMMQTLFRNPLAGPSVLGISSGASLGVALVVLGAAMGQRGARLIEGLGTGGNLTLVLASALGAILVLAAILVAARFVDNVMTLLIIGLLGGLALNAVVSVLIHFSRPELVQAYLSWTFGSFSSVTWREMRVFLPVLLLFSLLSLLVGKPLNGLLLGETYARSMGLGYLGVRLTVIGLTAVLVGCVTAYCGPVAFIGIAVPHLARAAAATSDHRILLPVSAALGAVVALGADILAQLPGSATVLPLNAVTALIGSPVIIWFILRRQRLQRDFF